MTDAPEPLALTPLDYACGHTGYEYLNPEVAPWIQKLEKTSLCDNCKQGIEKLYRIRQYIEAQERSNPSFAEYANLAQAWNIVFGTMLHYNDIN